MITKDILKTALGTELVVSSRILGKHCNKAEKNAERIHQSDTHIGKLVSYSTYNESYFKSPTQTHSDWSVVTSDRTKRFLLEFKDNSGNDLYAIISGADIICPKVQVEARWAQEAVLRAQQSAERDQIAEAERQMEEKRKSTELTLRSAVESTLVELFGANWHDKGVRGGYVRTQSEVKRGLDGNLVSTLRNTGDIEIPVDLFLKMVHRFSEQ